MKDKTLTSLRTQLLLFAAAQGAMFWYAIEKIFYLEQGVTLSQVVVIGILAQASKFFFEVPTSVFADRWSRRGTLLAANAIFVLATIMLGLSSSFLYFAVGVVVWSLSDALRSGVYDAFTYDGLKQHGLQKHYKEVHTRMVSLEMASIGLAGLAAGWIGQVVNLRINFFLSIIPVAVASIVLLEMKEPKIERTREHGENWLRHISGATKIMRGTQLRWVVMLTAAILGFTFLWYEYYQLVGVDVGLPTAWFGVLIAAVTLGIALGAELAHRKPGTKTWLFAGWMGIALTLLIGLRANNAVLVIANIVVFFVAIRMLRVYLEVYIHDRIPSSRRATIFSLASTLGYIWFAIMAGLFSWLLPRYGARTTFTYVGLVLLGFAAVDIAKGLKWSTSKKAPLVLEEADRV